MRNEQFENHKLILENPMHDNTRNNFVPPEELKGVMSESKMRRVQLALSKLSKLQGLSSNDSVSEESAENSYERRHLITVNEVQEDEFSNASVEPNTNEALYDSVAYALFDFETDIAAQMGFQTGDKLKVMSKETVNQGWWRAKSTCTAGRTGLVPSNYLKLSHSESVVEGPLPVPPKSKHRQTLVTSYFKPTSGRIKPQK